MNPHLTPTTLTDFLHGELAAQEDALVHAHLAACSQCRHAHDMEAALTELLRSAAAAEEREMPSLVAARVWERIRAAEPGPMARLAAVFRPVVAIPVAAVLLLGGWFASPLSHPQAHPTIDANYYFAAHAADASQLPLSERATPQSLESGITVSRVSVPLLDAYATYDASGALDAVR